MHLSPNWEAQMSLPFLFVTMVELQPEAAAPH
jgi:hypothetical protein